MSCSHRLALLDLGNANSSSFSFTLSYLGRFNPQKLVRSFVDGGRRGRPTSGFVHVWNDNHFDQPDNLTHPPFLFHLSPLLRHDRYERNGSSYQYDLDVALVSLQKGLVYEQTTWVTRPT